MGIDAEAASVGAAAGFAGAVARVGPPALDWLPDEDFGLLLEPGLTGGMGADALADFAASFFAGSFFAADFLASVFFASAFFESELLDVPDAFASGGVGGSGAAWDAAIAPTVATVIATALARIRVENGDMIEPSRPGCPMSAACSAMQIDETLTTSSRKMRAKEGLPQPGPDALSRRARTG
ncbi:hypothetical protein [Xanthobacter pseudotagetidis]|uniref:hypothetical protein n=1 Tax=Xanthobacter pseudotagetidis TaxID=3119911 RepID=UPI00372AC95A